MGSACHGDCCGPRHRRRSEGTVRNRRAARSRDPWTDGRRLESQVEKDSKRPNFDAHRPEALRERRSDCVQCVMMSSGIKCCRRPTIDDR